MSSAAHSASCDIPHPPLHRPILCRIGIIPGALYLVRVAAVALVGFDPLTRFKEVSQNLVKDLNICELTGRVRTLNPNQSGVGFLCVWLLWCSIQYSSLLEL